MPAEPQDYALVVGINHYPRYGSKGADLKGAIPDAQAVAAWLMDEATGGGVPAGQCQLLVSSVDAAGDTRPTKDEIDDALEGIDKSASQTGARRLYVYFSGHGQSQTTQDVALCLPHWSRRRQQAALSLRGYQRYLMDCLPFQQVVFLVDCCRSLSVQAKGQESELTCPVPQASAGKTLSFVAHATQFQTQAFEGTLGTPAEGEEPIVRGYFTAALLGALKGAAARPGGGVTGSALWSYLDKVVPRLAKRGGYDQQPVIEPFGLPPGHANEPVLGAAPPIEMVDVSISFKPGRVGPIRLEGPTLEVVRQGTATTGPWEETLPAAKYLLTDLASGEGVSFNLRSVAEGKLDVEL